MRDTAEFERQEERTERVFLQSARDVHLGINRMHRNPRGRDHWAPTSDPMHGSIPFTHGGVRLVISDALKCAVAFRNYQIGQLNDALERYIDSASDDVPALGRAQWSIEALEIADLIFILDALILRDLRRETLADGIGFQVGPDWSVRCIPRWDHRIVGFWQNGWKLSPRVLEHPDCIGLLTYFSSDNCLGRRLVTN